MTQRTKERVLVIYTVITIVIAGVTTLLYHTGNLHF